LQLQLQHKRVSIEAESVDGKCLAFVCLARELYTYIYINISMHILYISTDRLILGVQCGSCLHYNCRSSLDQKRWLPFASALAFVLVFQFQLFSFSVFHRLGERPSLDDRLTELAMPTAKTKWNWVTGAQASELGWGYDFVTTAGLLFCFVFQLRFWKP